MLVVEFLIVVIQVVLLLIFRRIFFILFGIEIWNCGCICFVILLSGMLLLLINLIWLMVICVFIVIVSGVDGCVFFVWFFIVIVSV